MKTALEHAKHWGNIAVSLQDCYKSLSDDFRERRYDTRIDSEALIKLAYQIKLAENLLNEARENYALFARMLPSTPVRYTSEHGVLKGNKSEG